MAEIDATPKLTYYQRNKDRARAKAKEYYQRVTEGQVGRRNEKRPPPTEPKKPRGRPRKTVLNLDKYDTIVLGSDFSTKQSFVCVRENGAYKSPEDNRDIIFEALPLPDSCTKSAPE